MSPTVTDRAGMGALEGDPTYFNSAALTTAVMQVTGLPEAPSSGFKGILRLELTNPNAAATIFWTTVPKGNAAPTMTTTYADVNTCNPVLPGTSKAFNIPTGRDVYLISDTAAQKVNVTAYLFI